MESEPPPSPSWSTPLNAVLLVPNIARLMGLGPPFSTVPPPASEPIPPASVYPSWIMAPLATVTDAAPPAPNEFGLPGENTPADTTMDPVKEKLEGPKVTNPGPVLLMVPPPEMMLLMPYP